MHAINGEMQRHAASRCSVDGRLLPLLTALWRHVIRLGLHVDDVWVEIVVFPWLPRFLLQPLQLAPSFFPFPKLQPTRPPPAILFPPPRSSPSHRLLPLCPFLSFSFIFFSLLFLFSLRHLLNHLMSSKSRLPLAHGLPPVSSAFGYVSRSGALELFGAIFSFRYLFCVLSSPLLSCLVLSVSSAPPHVVIVDSFFAAVNPVSQLVPRSCVCFCYYFPF